MKLPTTCRNTPRRSALLAALIATLLATTAMLASLPPVAAAGPTPGAPAVIITHADKLNGYIAAKDFLSHFSSSPYPAPDRPLSTHAFAEPRVQQHAYLAPHEAAQVPPYRVHCTVADADSNYAQLVRDLGCTVHEVRDTVSPDAWKRVLKEVDDAKFVVYVPDMSDTAGAQARAAMSAIRGDPRIVHTVVWSRQGVDGHGTEDLTAFQWYRALERAVHAAMIKAPMAAAAASAGIGRYTVLRLAFALERFLNIAADIEDTSQLRLPLGNDGRMPPISLHDATWASHTLFQAAAAASPDPRFKPVMTLTTDTLVSGADIAAAATRGLSRDIEFVSISRAEARDIFMSLENVTPELATVLLDVFECARRANSGCRAIAPRDDVEALLPGEREPKSPEWFFAKYADMFSSGGV
ncbi:hypothetical protein H9P43_002486 [Blastocladiella emersonii ATCC 22665]|nr:hypothetical protein H9P43_002486 [Blastocladiella emersonii ATCC 22665]